MDPIIKIENLNFTYNKDKDNEFQALININCQIYPEEFIIIFGPSGCGKSTLLHSIAGLEKPENGVLAVAGKDITKLSKWEYAQYHRSLMGMVYQQYNLINSLTVLENVALPQLFVDVRMGKRNKWARRLLERFGILKQAKKLPAELSGGQQQRIGIARAIVNNPSIILADEPVGNLDSVSAKNVLDILADLNSKEKKTVIMVTHNPENLSYGDRIFYMKDGIITREVVNRDKHKQNKPEMVPKTTAAEINDLMRAYHGLTPEQINILIMPYKAKAFAHHFISSRNMEETKVLEDIIQRRLLGTISQEDFFEILHKSTTESGVGFDVRTAEKLLRRVNRIIRTAYYIYQEDRQRIDKYGKHIKVSDEEKAEKVTWYLLKSCYNKYYQNLDETQINRLKQVINDRLTAVIQKKGFYEALDKPFHDGGVGLNRKTARAMCEELELILILGFGIVQKTEAEEENEKKSVQPSPLSAIEENIAIQRAEKAVGDSDIPEESAEPSPASEAEKDTEAGEEVELTTEDAINLANVSTKIEKNDGSKSGSVSSEARVKTLHEQIIEAQKMKDSSRQFLNDTEKEMSTIKKSENKNVPPDQTADNINQ